jgi:putative hemolysin
MDPDPLPNLFLLALEPSISVSSIALISFVLVALLFLSAVLAGSEVAFFSLNADQRIYLRESEVSSEKKVSVLLEKPQQLLATLLISINFHYACQLFDLAGDGRTVDGDGVSDPVFVVWGDIYHYVFR